jgi:CRP-like cAMP-binding protein
MRARAGDRISMARPKSVTRPRRPAWGRTSSGRQAETAAGREPAAARKAEAREARVICLRRCPILRGLTQEDLDLVLESAKQERAAKGGVFFQGHPVSRIYVLVRGRVKIIWTDPQGDEVITRVVRPGDAFGHIAAWGGQDRLIRAQAAEDSEALAVDAERLMQIIARRPVAALNGLRVLARQVFEGWQSFRILATEPAERRIAWMLLKLVRPDGGDREGAGPIQLPLSQQDLAELAGTTVFTVSRLMGRWKRQGIVAVGRGKVTVLDSRALAAGLTGTGDD